MDLIWDFDGTLFDTYPLMAASLQQAMREEGHEVPIEDIRARMAVTLGYALKCYEEMYGITDRTVERYKELMQNAGTEAAAPFDGVKEICKWVCENGGKNHLCTHRSLSAKNYMDHWGISAYFDVYVTADDRLPRKPAPDMVEKILSETGKKSSEFIMMGDRELDILAARGAGVKGCLFTNGKAEVETVAEYQIRTYKEFFDKIGEEKTK